MQDKRKVAKKVSNKNAISILPESQEQSSEFDNQQSDDISELINALKHKFTKKNVESQKHLENEVTERTMELRAHINEAFKLSDAAIESKLQAIRGAFEQHSELRENTLKELKTNYAKFSAQVDAAIDTIDTSNNDLTRLIHEFNRDADVQKTKRKESLQRVAVETDNELEMLKKKLLSYASKNNNGVDSIRSSLKSLMNFQ